MQQLILNSNQLESAIALQQQETESRYEALVNSFENAMESIKPANLVKSTISDIVENAPVTKTETGLAIAAGAGLLSKKIVTGSSKSILRSLLGTAMQLVITGGLSKKSDELGRAGNRLLKKIIT